MTPVFREPTDREWHLYFTGEVQVYSWAGAALVVHDATGKIIHREVVPRGIYPEEKPYVVTVKPDGMTGDYRAVMVGHQIQFLGVCGMVWSDLPLEVYGGARVSVEKSPANKPWFKAPDGVTKMKLGAAKGNFESAGQRREGRRRHAGESHEGERRRHRGVRCDAGAGLPGRT